MGRFVLPAEWYDTPAPPPPDPMAAREEKVANDTRVESEINRFLAARQDALFHAPDAFYRTGGEDAIHAAPETTRKLDALRRDLIDRAANDYQRGRLGAALGAQMELTRDGMARHVAEQSLAWQRQVAQDRIALLTKDTAAATARSGVLGAAIQARLDRGDMDGAKALLTRVQDQLDPEHATPINDQIAQAEQPATLPDGPYYFDAIPGSGGMEPEEKAPPSAGGVEPPPGSPEYQAAEAEAEGLERENPSPEPATQAVVDPIDTPFTGPEPAPGSLTYENAMTIAVGHPVTLPDGSTIADDTSPTGKVMSPIPNLDKVAAAGRKAGDEYRGLLENPATAENAIASLFTNLGMALGHGGEFDYQRGPGNSLAGFEQRPQFRNISNINVGLFGQQAGLTLEQLLTIAGLFARLRSSNSDSKDPYHLDARTRKFIELGYQLGASGKFDKRPP